MELLLIIGWLIGTGLNGMIAEEKGYSVGIVIVCSIFFSPLVVYMYLLAVPIREKKPSGEIISESEYCCTKCSAKVSLKDKFCPNCGDDVREIETNDKKT